jgi:alanine dehydrogenase
MRIGVPKEIKVHEYRVGMVPAGVRELVGAGHEVTVETGAGAGIGVDDAQYKAAGATIAAKAADIFGRAEMIVKVKEPQLHECQMLKPGQVLFTYLHLAADPAQAQALMKSGATAIAYETVTAPNGSLPLLTPMSEVAGRMSIQVGAASLQKAAGGYGVLLGGVPGVPPAKVVILGGGVAGTHAAEIAVGMRADVTIVDRSVQRLREFRRSSARRLQTAYSTSEAVEHLVRDADIVDGRGVGGRRCRSEARDARHAGDDEAGRRAGRYLHRPGWLLRDQQGRRLMPIRRLSWMASFTTVLPTCLVRCRVPPHSR